MVSQPTWFVFTLVVALIGNVIAAKAEILSCQTTKSSYIFKVEEGFIRSSLHMIDGDKMVPFSEVKINEASISAKYIFKDDTTIKLLINRIDGSINFNGSNPRLDESGKCIRSEKQF